MNRFFFLSFIIIDIKCVAKVTKTSTSSVVYQLKLNWIKCKKVKIESPMSGDSNFRQAVNAASLSARQMSSTLHSQIWRRDLNLNSWIQPTLATEVDVSLTKDVQISWQQVPQIWLSLSFQLYVVFPGYAVAKVEFVCLEEGASSPFEVNSIHARLGEEKSSGDVSLFSPGSA